jgi:formiminoglutamase
MTSWLTVRRGQAPLIVSLPHTGTTIPNDYQDDLVSLWLARKDADWWIDQLYDFAAGLDATVIHTAISRTVIDVNRDPSGDSLYPGQETTELCPTTTFDGEPLYKEKRPDEAAVARRRSAYFAPYHDALTEEIARLRAVHSNVVLYDCHSIRSVIPRLFEGTLPDMNIGTNSGQSCDPALTNDIASLASGSSFDHVVNGRFRGGWITRQYGRPGEGVHAVQMELACRSYMRETLGPVNEPGWPTPYDEAYAAPMRDLLQNILRTCIRFAEARNTVKVAT